MTTAPHGGHGRTITGRRQPGGNRRR